MAEPMSNDNWLQLIMTISTLVAIIAGWIANYIIRKRADDKEIALMKEKFDAKLAAQKNEIVEILKSINEANNRINVIEEKIRAIKDTNNELKEFLNTELNEVKTLIQKLTDKMSNHMENHS